MDVCRLRRLYRLVPDLHLPVLLATLDAAIMQPHLLLKMVQCGFMFMFCDGVKKLLCQNFKVI